MDNYSDVNRGGHQPVKPNNYLILAIFTTVCCCLPLGIVGIVYATKVDTLYNTGQYEAAYRAADDAKKWSLIGLVIGAIGMAIYAAAVVLFGVGAAGGFAGLMQ